MENPAKKPINADYNSTQQIRTKSYYRRRSSRTRRRRSDKVNPAVYKVPTVESQSMLILSILYQPFISNLSGGTMASGPIIPTPAPSELSMWTTAAAVAVAPESAASTWTSTWTTYTETTRYRNAPKRTGKLLIEMRSLITYFCRSCRRG